MKFRKYHALGNDYLVADFVAEATVASDVDPRTVRALCERHTGVGADGLLVGGPLPDGRFTLAIFNPDGSEAEKSGNGLRIFARYLHDRGLVSQAPFGVQTKGGDVVARVLDGGAAVTVEMGAVSFDAAVVPVLGERGEVLDRPIVAGGAEFRYSAATVGNPHCVILCDDPTQEIAQRVGPLVERDSRFPRRTNVQFARVLDRSAIRLEIWERGAGYTTASGSSATAAAAVAVRLGFCDSRVRVVMPGGELLIELDEAFRAVMTGPVAAVCSVETDNELFAPTRWVIP